MPDKKSSSIRELFLNNKRGLLSYLTRRVGRDDASDLLQETFVRAIRHEHFDTIADPPSMLRRIAINLTSDFARRRKTENKYFEFGELPEDAPSLELLPDERMESDEKWRILYGVVHGLAPRCREVFLLYVFESLSLSEIAQRLGMSQNMAQRHMRLAVRRCMAALR